jgi:hypothetical protein
MVHNLFRIAIVKIGLDGSQKKEGSSGSYVVSPADEIIGNEK